MIDAKTNKVVIKAGDKVAPRLAKQLQAEQKTPHIRVSFEQIDGRFAALDIINEKTGEIYVEAGEELIIDYDKDGKIKGGNVMALIEAGVTDVPTLDINADAGPYMRNTMIMDKNYNHETALLDIYRIMRPGEPPALETALDFFNGLFFKPDNYDLSAVGRVKINSRLDMKADASERILSKEDIVGVVKELVDLRDGRGETDDIDHLGNRRVRSVGELMEIMTPSAINTTKRKTPGFARFSPNGLVVRVQRRMLLTRRPIKLLSKRVIKLPRVWPSNCRQSRKLRISACPLNRLTGGMPRWISSMKRPVRFM